MIDLGLSKLAIIGVVALVGLYFYPAPAEVNATQPAQVQTNTAQ